MTHTPVEVLLVEDNPDDLALTMMALRKGKLANDIVVARDGVEALDFLFGRGEHAGRNTADQPKIVLLDLKLPRIDGHEVLRAIRENPLTRNLPVIVMTSSDQDRDVLVSYELKANSYVVKPVSFDQFHEAVTQVGMYWLLLNHPPVAAALTIPCYAPVCHGWAVNDRHIPLPDPLEGQHDVRDQRNRSSAGRL